MSSMLLSMEKSAGGEIVSNLCSFQAKESQPHSLLGGEAVGRGYAPPTPWNRRSQRKNQVPAHGSGGEGLPPPPPSLHPDLPIPGTSRSSLPSPRKRTVTAKGFRGIVKRVALTATRLLAPQSIPV